MNNDSIVFIVYLTINKIIILDETTDQWVAVDHDSYPSPA